MLRNRLVMVVVGVGLLSLAAAGQAGVILSPVAVVSNTAGTTPGSPIESAINHAGLLTDFTSGVTDFDTYLALNPLHTEQWIANEWFALDGENEATVIFDLGAEYEISRVAFWNEEHSGAFSASFFACSDALCSVQAGLGGFAILDSPFFVSYSAQVLDTSDVLTRYVGLTVQGPNDPFNFNSVSLAEIAFDAGAAEPVPEPSSIALLTLGLGALARRRAMRNKASRREE